MNYVALQKLKQFTALLLAICLLNVSVPAFVSSAHADAISTAELRASLSIAEKRDAIRTSLAREDVRTALLERGVNEAQIESRIDNMSDAEVLQMHEQIDKLPAGEGLLGTVIALLVIFMLLDIGGVTDIFPDI